MNVLTTEQLGRLIKLLRDTEIPDGSVTTNLIDGNEDIWKALNSEFIRRVDEEDKKGPWNSQTDYMNHGKILFYPM